MSNRWSETPWVIGLNLNDCKNAKKEKLRVGRETREKVKVHLLELKGKIFRTRHFCL